MTRNAVVISCMFISSSMVLQTKAATCRMSQMTDTGRGSQAKGKAGPDRDEGEAAIENNCQ